MPIPHEDPAQDQPSCLGNPISRRSFLTLTAFTAAAACSGRPAPTQGIFVWGGQGTRDGEFLRPRAIGVRAGEVYVVDTTGRVQVFTRDGHFLRLWHMPEHENGTPTCVSFTTDGHVLIPDTHYSRIAEYSTDGTQLRMWGAYGTDPGKFIYPTGIVQAAQGDLYVSEYGVGAERVQVFDRDGVFQRTWGSHGTGPGQFNRAMAITLGADDSVLVADTTNHRIQRSDTQGRLIGIIGSPGTNRGELKFPQSISVAPDASLVVCEYGANRVSRFSLDGHFLGAFGAAGRSSGEFHAPRGVAVSEAGEVFVADTENHRVQRFPLEVIA